MRRWLNIATGSALGFITIVGIWKANPETLKAQPFLLDGSNGVRISLLMHPVLAFCKKRKTTPLFHKPEEQPIIGHILYRPEETFLIASLFRVFRVNQRHLRKKNFLHDFVPPATKAWLKKFVQYHCNHLVACRKKNEAISVLHRQTQRLREKTFCL